MTEKVSHSKEILHGISGAFRSSSFFFFFKLKRFSTIYVHVGLNRLKPVSPLFFVSSKQNGLSKAPFSRSFQTRKGIKQLIELRRAAKSRLHAKNESCT